MTNKGPIIGLIAGTHQREIEFSHPVADILLSYFGKSFESPSDVKIGVDGATIAKVWNLGNLVVAKLFPYGNGEPTLDWVRSQSVERQKYLAGRKVAWSNQKRPPRVAEIYGGEHQWTSVHDPLIKQFQLYFFIDLHSYHVTCRKPGKGMEIWSQSDESIDSLMLSALANAKYEHPEIYGIPQSVRLAEIKKDLTDKYFQQEELVKFLTGNNKFPFYKRQKSYNKELAKLNHKELNRLNNNGWSFIPGGIPEPRCNYYCFEAKHWQKNQQEAAAKFIVEYLLPAVGNHKNSA
jgi:hypothetical protein